MNIPLLEVYNHSVAHMCAGMRHAGFWTVTWGFLSLLTVFAVCVRSLCVCVCVCIYARRHVCVLLCMHVHGLMLLYCALLCLYLSVA